MSVPAFIISVPVSHTMLQKEWEAAAQEEWENNPPVTTSMLTASKPEDPHPADSAAQKADDEKFDENVRRKVTHCSLCVLFVTSVVLILVGFVWCCIFVFPGWLIAVGSFFFFPCMFGGVIYGAGVLYEMGGDGRWAGW